MPVIEFIPRKVTLDDPPILPPLDIICKPEILPDKALNAFVGLVSKDITEMHWENMLLVILARISREKQEQLR